VALLGAAVTVLALVAYHKLDEAAIAAFISATLVVVAATDLERRVIPNQVVLPATAIIVLARIATSPGRSFEFVLAAVGAGALFLLPNLIGRSAMGMGDVKLALFLGAGLGWGVIGAITIAFVAIFPVAVGTLVRGGLAARKAALPFAPFLALGGMVILIVPRLVGLGGS
jgi:prepilin signal peptidase PulO-like enzyme (type II secretory pathway)